MLLPSGMEKAADPARVLFDADADERLAAIVDSSFDAIVSKDLNSIIRSWNVSAEKLFGYSAEEAIGQSVLMLIPEHLRSEEETIITRIRAGERVASYDTIRRRKDGTHVAVSITVSPVRNKAGEIVGASKIARDITAARESERRIRLLMREVNHRTKNQFAVILAIIRETRKRAATPEEFEQKVSERIMALSASHDLLVSAEWSGATLFDLVQEHLKPFGHEDQVTLTGPLLTLGPNSVQHLGMAFHELATNSAKYGALSGEAGRITLTWQVIDQHAGPRQFEIRWRETFASGAHDGAVPQKTGFGTVVLQRVAPQAVGGTATLERLAGSVHWKLVAPLDAIVTPSIADMPSLPG